ncbi:Flavodoxin reductases (ferredoxin-NADPH reductases) family 1 [Alloactinosynnema sp. L-07]|uniref:ferredoxin reductase n=1 Tax=Alloactinosynnema sp. L-07 TaxID=1653480 RepID=UPI00065EFCCE|nr:ferredoxin reductase [Alloactinosynnema sp. L-07]CRK55616.1 Flavodoxin reductases (ferredoxin-NADPH reductases) family 1 [Alloactinosynnema sp. L-07]
MRTPGLRLLEALATPHGVDRYLELINPMLVIRDLRGEVTAVHRSTPDTVTLTIRPTRRWRGFTAGQYVRVSVDIDGVRRTRCYSPATSQHRDGRFELIVKVHHEGMVSRWLREHAKPGLVLHLSQPEGTFTLPLTRPDKILLISGGSGITPVLSMLRTLADEGYQGQVAFLHYAYRESDVPAINELRARDAVLAYTDADDGDLTGFFDETHLRKVAPWYAEAQTYLCGPPGLMRSVRETFADLGVADRLHTEDFAPAPITTDASEATGHVTFARSDKTAANSGATLLDQAEAAGLKPEHGCRMGICFSCTRVKTAGRVRDVRNGALSTDPDEEIQLCVSVPVGDVAIDL